ncbi:MAG: DUF2149 domain-containing protein [Oleiphilus sp.]
MDRWHKSAFIETDEDPLGPMANLIDVVLVFACGLIVALVSISPDLQTHFNQQKVEHKVSLSRELPTVPQQVEKALSGGEGYESLGQVFRDPETGKLILIGK